MSEQNSQGSVAAVSASTSSNVAGTNAVTTDATTQAGAATSNPSQMKMSDTVSSLEDFKKKAPDVYKQMMLGIATTICNQMQRNQARLKQAIRDGQR